MPGRDAYDNGVLWLEFAKAPENREKSGKAILETFYEGLVSSFGKSVEGRAHKLIVRYDAVKNRLSLGACGESVKQTHNLAMPVAVRNHFNDAVELVADALHSQGDLENKRRAADSARDQHARARSATVEAALGEDTDEVIAAARAYSELDAAFADAAKVYDGAKLRAQDEAKAMTAAMRHTLSEWEKHRWLAPIIARVVDFSIETEARRRCSAEHVAPTIR